MKKLKDKIFEVIQKHSWGLTWEEEIDVLFNMISVCVPSNIDEKHLSEYLDYQEGIILRRLKERKERKKK